MAILHTHMVRCLLVSAIGVWSGCGRTAPANFEEPALQMPPPPPVAQIEDTNGSRRGSASESPPAQIITVEKYSHKVQWRNETLYTIAIWYTGSGKNWEHIAAVNPGIKPTRIRIGDTILIPRNLLKRRRPMPEKFVISNSPKPRTPPPRSTNPPSPKNEDITLFGPLEGDSPVPKTEKGNLSETLEKLDE